MTSWASRKNPHVSYESKFSHHMRNMGNAIEYFMFVKWKSNKILVCLCIFNKHFWVKNKGTILFTNHFYLGWKENSLLDWLRSHEPWSFPEKLHDFNETAAAPKLLYYLFWIDHLRVGKSLFKRRTKVFSFYIISEMFRTNRLFVDLVAN